MRKIMLF